MSISLQVRGEDSLLDSLSWQRQAEAVWEPGVLKCPSQMFVWIVNWHTLVMVAGKTAPDQPESGFAQPVAPTTSETP
jgi:hypothetical protein